MGIEELIELLTRFKEQHGSDCSVFVGMDTACACEPYDIKGVEVEYDFDNSPYAIITI